MDEMAEMIAGAGFGNVREHKGKNWWWSHTVMQKVLEFYGVDSMGYKGIERHGPIPPANAWIINVPGLHWYAYVRYLSSTGIGWWWNVDSKNPGGPRLIGQDDAMCAVIMHERDNRGPKRSR